jgi:hypothetical protein
LCPRCWTPRCSAEQKRDDRACGPNIFSCVFPCRHKSPRARANLLHNKKAPRDTWGLLGGASSREKRWLLRRGRVAWLAAHFSRLQWRDRGRFSRPSPLPLPANWKFSVCRGSGSVNVWHEHSATKASWPHEFSDFSSSVCAFRPARVALLENPRDGTIH